MLYLCGTCHREWKGMVHCTIESLTVVSFAITAIRYQMLCMMIKQIALLIIMNHGMIMSCSWWVVLWEWHEDGIKYEDKCVLRWYAKWFNWSDVSMQRKSIPVSDDSLLWWSVAYTHWRTHTVDNRFTSPMISLTDQPIQRPVYSYENASQPETGNCYFILFSKYLHFWVPMIFKIFTKMFTKKCKIFTKKIQNIYEMFAKMQKLEEIYKIFTENLQNIYKHLQTCKNSRKFTKYLQKIYKIFTKYFSKMQKLGEIDKIITENLQNISEIFAKMQKLEEIYKIFTENLQNICKNAKTPSVHIWKKM